MSLLTKSSVLNCGNEVHGIGDELGQSGCEWNFFFFFKLTGPILRLLYHYDLQQKR